ncbi:hypothetical protein OAO55_00285 [Bacteroidales bacterium]|nr:hypothetical protein [Bacteroidales bacterium]
MSLNKALSILLWVLMGVSVVFVVLFYAGGSVPGTEGTPTAEPLITNTILNWSYILVGVAALFSIVFPIVHMFSSKKAALKTLQSLGILVAVVVLANFLASDKPLVTELVTYDNVKELKNVGIGLITTYLLLGGAVVAILYSEVAKVFK